MNFPTLYKLTSTGKVQEWTITTIGHTITTVYGLADGKKQIATEEITVGKNVGKANETTPIEQAEVEAKATWEKKLKSGYVQNIDDAKSGKTDKIIAGGISPMLAHKHSEQGHKILYPAFAQPKLDGHRCIAVINNGVCTLWSRTRKQIHSMPHIVAALEKAFAGKTLVIDGELYNHDYREKFEELTSKIRQTKPVPGHEVVQYWIYDLAGDGDFYQRTQLLNNYALSGGFGQAKTGNPLVLVATFVVDDEADLTEKFQIFLDHGYEGAMVRNARGKYKNSRSYDLQKVKDFQDAEFEIVDVVPGTGHMHDKGIFVCVTDSGEEFKAKMVGPLDSLCKYLDNKNDYIGEWLTVKFQKYSAKGVPVFGVGMRIREDV